MGEINMGGVNGVSGNSSSTEAYLAQRDLDRADELRSSGEGQIDSANETLKDPKSAKKPHTMIQAAMEKKEGKKDVKEAEKLEDSASKRLLATEQGQGQENYF